MDGMDVSAFISTLKMFKKEAKCLIRTTNGTLKNALIKAHNVDGVLFPVIEPEPENFGERETKQGKQN